MIKMPADWRALTVRNIATNEIETLEVRISGFGGVYDLSDSVTVLTGAPNGVAGHRALWEGGDWASAPSPCRAVGPTSLFGSTGFQFFWLTPTPTICAKQAKYLIPGLGYRYVDFSYELRTPNPLKMSTGAYVGSTVYTVGGATSDLDFGDILLPDDGILQLDFTLTVEHTLKVDIPPGGNSVELVPQGGWQNWLQNGRKPTRLFRDQIFNISTSSRFKMILQCEIEGLFDCQIRDRNTGRNAVVNTSVSLPNGLTDLAGQPVNRVPLQVGQAYAKEFKPGFYVDRKPGVLHFEISPYYVNLMLQPGVAAHYAGSITVIWDSEV
jgi:hypothetical protein